MPNASPGAEPPEQPAITFEVIVPEAMSAGNYANGFVVWFNQTDFTLDGFVYLPAEPRQDEDENTYLNQPVQVVTRVKFPPAMMFPLLQNLNRAMTDYEAQFGSITPLGDPIPPPADDQPTA